MYAKLIGIEKSGKNEDTKISISSNRNGKTRDNYCREFDY